MSKTKLISPLLDGYIVGDPVSDHNGVRCCPAVHMESGKKYIVKIISLPASQSNLEALLLAGAFENKKAALGYYKELADEIVEDAVRLQRFSRQEGFVSYENWQVVPPEEGRSGYDIYLLGAYGSTLEQYFEKEFMTHLRAVNLGLDLCAALSVCRRNGYLYADLKPDNVVITEDGEYRICDLGFLPLSSLNYISLPDKFRSPYTAPEIKDAYDTLTDTIDIYAAGLILYQAYNNGILPFSGQAPEETLDPPAYADSEMAQIILKACAPDPKDRWQDPVQMGQALVSYMQRTTINDVPIAPVPDEPEQEDEEPVADESSTEQLLVEVDMALEATGSATEENLAEETPVEETPAEETPAEETPVEETPAEETPVEEAPVEEAPVEEAPVEEAPVEEVPVQEVPVQEVPVEEVPVQEVPVEETPVEEVPVTETPVEDSTVDLDDIDAILAQADALIAHELPNPVVVPEYIDIPVPVIAPASVTDVKQPAKNEQPIADITIKAPASPVACTDKPENKQEDAPIQKPKKRRKGLLWIPIVLLLLLGLIVGGYLFYTEYYIQPIQNFKLSGNEDQLTVFISSDIDDTLLTVSCSDMYGNTVTADVENGIATFTQLHPGTRYRVYVTISGFHKLVGVVEDVYTTPSTTSIETLNAVTGSEDGSVILNFTVQGDDSSEWTVFYQAEGEEEQSLVFPGHRVVISGLTVGKAYTFRIVPVSELYLVGENTFTYTASQIIYAENLVIESASGGKLVAVWNAPESTTVESWTVYCYNDAGFNSTITVTEPTAVFEDLDFSTEYTVEVTAVGMTQSVRTYISPNPITIESVTFDDSDPNKLIISWEFEGEAPEEGWLLLYTMDASNTPMPLKSAANSVTLSPVVPGSTYTISIQTVAGYTVFSSNCQYQAPEASSFSGYGMVAKYMKFEMCIPPSSGNWTKADLAATDYKTDFSVGESAAFAVTLLDEYNTSPDIIVALFVIRDAEGNVVMTDNSQSKTWTSMWYRGFGRILIPDLPDTAGAYTIEVYFNGMIAHTQEFTIQ